MFLSTCSTCMLELVSMLCCSGVMCIRHCCWKVPMLEPELHWGRALGPYCQHHQNFRGVSGISSNALTVFRSLK